MTVYHLEKAHFLDGIWYPAGADIEWAGPPSQHMVPSAEWAERRRDRAERGGGPPNRARVISNPNANPPVVRGNTLPAKEANAGPEAPAESAGAPNDERNPGFVPPNQSRPINPGADEAAQVPSAPQGETRAQARARAKTERAAAREAKAKEKAAAKANRAAAKAAKVQR
ncbi:MAG: hypothetical protein LC750_00490 [Actinobacteria bacterium]|nr:hypothetical protein [Actinomycetota bacterium]